jgi:flagellar FliL protein
MFRNKLFNMALILIIAIALLGAVSFILWKMYLSPADGAEAQDKPKPLTAEEMVEFTFDTGEITTNLLTNNYIVVQFSITTDSKEAKEELEKRSPQVKQIIIKSLAALTPEDLKGEDGINKLEAKIMKEISEVMQEGKIVQVLTTKKILS